MVRRLRWDTHGVRTEGWVVLGLTVLFGSAMLAGAITLTRKERRISRIQLPARLVSKVWVVPGFMLNLEFPGPDGAPRRTSVFSAMRRGLGATPHFGGWVWVNRADPSDVIVRPRARAFWPVFLSVAGGIVLVFGLVATVVIWGIGAMDALPAQQ